MISIEVLVTQLPGLQRQDLERWIAFEWVRPDGNAGQYEFRAVDVARVRLIRELRDIMQVNEKALPVVLSLWTSFMTCAAACANSAMRRADAMPPHFVTTHQRLAGGSIAAKGCYGLRRA